MKLLLLIPVLLFGGIVGCNESNSGESTYEWCLMASQTSLSDHGQTKEFADRAERVDNNDIREFGERLNDFNNGVVPAEGDLSFLAATVKMIVACKHEGVDVNHNYEGE